MAKVAWLTLSGILDQDRVRPPSRGGEKLRNPL